MRQENQPTLGRREFLKESLSAAIAAGYFSRTTWAEAAGNIPRADKATQHNWMIVGKNTVFLSHLPMFNDGKFISPHRYQVILEATFAKPGSDPQALYFNDRKANPGVKIYTLNPEDFVLPEVGVGTRGSFKGKVFRAHFERPERVLLAEEVLVNVSRVIQFREFNPKEKKPSKLQYILFGKGEEIFLAHSISKAPDFDQILSVKLANHSLTDETLSKGVVVTVNRPNTLAQRLKETQQVKVKLPVTRRPDLSGQEIEIKAETEFYLEEGELRVPADFDTTAEERAAGFP